MVGFWHVLSQFRSLKSDTLHSYALIFLGDVCFTNSFMHLHEHNSSAFHAHRKVKRSPFDSVQIERCASHSSRSVLSQNRVTKSSTVFLRSVFRAGLLGSRTEILAKHACTEAVVSCYGGGIYRRTHAYIPVRWSLQLVTRF